MNRLRWVYHTLPGVLSGRWFHKIAVKTGPNYTKGSGCSPTCWPNSSLDQERRSPSGTKSSVLFRLSATTSSFFGDPSYTPWWLDTVSVVSSVPTTKSQPSAQRSPLKRKRGVQQGLVKPVLIRTRWVERLWPTTSVVSDRNTKTPEVQGSVGVYTGKVKNRALTSHSTRVPPGRRSLLLVFLLVLLLRNVHEWSVPWY